MNKKNIVIGIGIFLSSCGLQQEERSSKNSVVEDAYIDEKTINSSYIEYGDTARWTNFNSSIVTIHMRHPIIKINMSAPNDMALIYKQLDSAIAFANMIGFENAEYHAMISPFNSLSYSYEDDINEYIDTAKWLPQADVYLRERCFWGIYEYASSVPSFLPFKTKVDNEGFNNELKENSVAYVVFVIYNKEFISDKASCPSCFTPCTPSIGKTKSSTWKKRQTKPYPRTP